MPKDLRSHIAYLEKNMPGEIITVKKGPLDPAEGEPCVILHKFEKLGKWPMAIFENVLNLNKKRWPGRIAFSEIGTWTKIGAALEFKENAEVPEILQEIFKRGQNPIKPITIDKKDAPVKETIWLGEKADNFDLPCYRKDSKDSRPGWICGIAVAKELTTGRYNCSWHRHQVMAPNRSGARIQYRHLWEYMSRYREAGFKEIPVAWVYGHHPMFNIAASGKISWDFDEYEYASGLIGEPLRLVSSETLGDDFMLPADAEVIVEGYLHLNEKEFNGPWTDYMRYYSPQTLEPLFRPTAITTRENPIFLHVFTGHELLNDIGQITEVYLELKRRYPRVKAVNYLAPFTFVVQFKPAYPGETNRLAAHAIGALGDLVKNIIIVDEDIDPFDPYMVFFSIATRVDANKSQVQILKDLWANRHDPAAFDFLKVGGLMIDSTKPTDQPFPEIGYPAKDVWDNINLEDYFDKEAIDGVSAGKIVTTWHGI